MESSIATFTRLRYVRVAYTFGARILRNVRMCTRGLYRARFECDVRAPIAYGLTWELA